MKYTKCNEEQFFKIFPPENRQSWIMTPNEPIQVIKHNRLVVCDSCNQLMFQDEKHKTGGLLMEVEGYRTERLMCENCFKRYIRNAKQYDNEEEELDTDEAIKYIYSNEGYPDESEFYDDEDDLDIPFNEKE